MDSDRRHQGDPPPLPDPAAAVSGALARPLGLPALASFVEPGDRVAIAIARDLEAAAPWLLPVVQAALAAAGPSQVAIVGADGSEPLYVAGGKVEGLGIVRFERSLLEADKVVFLAALTLDPDGCLKDAGLVLAAAASPPGAALPSRGEGVGLLLDLLPPVFLVEVAFQRGRRPAAVFAGGLREAHRAAAAFHRRWPGAAL